jgi:hypothetical protein
VFETVKNQWRSAAMRAGGAVAALLVVLGAGIGVAAPAAAGDQYTCPGYSSCTWKNLRYETGQTSFQSYIRDFAQWDGYDNTATSLWNNGYQCTSQYFQYAGYTSDAGTRTLRFVRGSGTTDLRNYQFRDNGASWNDRISSGRFLISCT